MARLSSGTEAFYHDFDVVSRAVARVPEAKEEEKSTLESLGVLPHVVRPHIHMHASISPQTQARAAANHLVRLSTDGQASKQASQASVFTQTQVKPSKSNEPAKEPENSVVLPTGESDIGRRVCSRYKNTFKIAVRG